MKRLTKKEKNCLACYNYRECNYILDKAQRFNALEKLGNIEDLEEELNVEILIIYKALKNGFFDNKEEYHHFSNLFMNTEEIYDSYTKEVFQIKDYGITWALTEKELK